MARRTRGRKTRFKKRVSHKRNKKSRNILNVNSHILNGVSFMVLGILLMRFSPYIFISLLSWTEGVFWGYLIGFFLILGGIFSLIAWWRNNVSMMTTKHSVNWN